MVKKNTLSSLDHLKDLSIAPGAGLRIFIVTQFFIGFFVFAAPKFASLKEISYICSRKR